MNIESRAEIKHLKQQLQRGDLTGVRQYLSITLQTQDWQDRHFVLSLLAATLRAEVLSAASASEPEAADLFLLLGAYWFERTLKSRGAKQAEYTTEKQFRLAAEQIQTMMACLQRSYSLEAADPIPHIYAMRGLVVFSDYEDVVAHEYEEAVRIASDCLPAYYVRINTRAKKWGGSHEEALHIARAAQSAGQPGSDLPACLFLAHFLVWQYADLFDKDKSEAKRCLRDPEVALELNGALDRWIGGNYRPRRSSLPYLHQAALWYYLSGDYVRLKEILIHTGKEPYEQVWGQLGDAAATYKNARLKAAFASVKQTKLFGWLKR